MGNFEPIGIYCTMACLVFPQLIMWIILLSVMGSSRSNFELIQMRSVDQLMLDWNHPFINKIYSVDENRNCNYNDDPILAQVWFGVEHMCVDDYQWATKGSTCSYQSRHETCDSDGNNCEATTAKDYQSFPMVQDYVFGGKRFCG